MPRRSSRVSIRQRIVEGFRGAATYSSAVCRRVRRYTPVTASTCVRSNCEIQMNFVDVLIRGSRSESRCRPCSGLREPGQSQAVRHALGEFTSSALYQFFPMGAL